MVKFMARPFSGVVEDPGCWLDHYEMICGANGWNGDTQSIRNLPTCLTGEAEEWFWIEKDWLDAEDREWEEVKARLTERFRPLDFYERIEEQLREPVQKKGEKTQAYAERY